MRLGRLVAMALCGAWRFAPAPLCLDAAELSQVTPLLLAAGAGGLGWRRIQAAELSSSRPAMKLRQAYRLHALQAVLRQRELVAVTRLLRSAGVEPLLGKGWAVARLYPEPGLRPYGDLDLCVRPEQFAAAQEALRSPDAPGGTVDLHRGLMPQWEGAAFSQLDDRQLEELYERSQLVSLDGTPIRTLGPEDHLRFLCLHMLSHGAWRPLWLCDLAVALETRPPDFDWDWCLSGNRRRSDWVACSLGLAHQLLGARVDDTPIAARVQRLPRWLVPTVLRQWGQIYTHRTPISSCLRRPATMLKELRHHWPNGVEATVDVRGPFNEWPRLPFQLGATAVRAAEFLSGLTRQVRY
jgi:Uncharacterised nucleotidyltransferase